MKRMQWRKNRGKTGGLQRRWLKNILSIITGIVVLATAAFSIVNALYYYTTMRTGLETKAKTTVAFLNNHLSLTYREYNQACSRLAEHYEDKNSVELQFISSTGSLITSSYGQLSVGQITTQDVTQALETGEQVSFTGKDPATGERIIAVSAPMVYTDGRTVGVLRFVSSTRLVDRQILIYTVLILLVGMTVLLVVIVSSRYFIKSILEPVSEITETAKRIAGGSYGVQIQRKFDDEIGELADTINDMSNKISQNEKMQTEFVSSVSHELRTPLTAIGGWSETLLSGGATVDSADARRGLSIILRETKRLTGMVEELLEFTRMQDGRFTLNIAPGNIRSDFEDTVFMYGNRLKNENITLEYLDNDDDIPEISCDIPRMRQVYLNLLDNAAKHGGEGGKITAEIRREDSEVVIRIRDFGPGIPEDELPLVKKKFYKGTSKARGSGIGLAVCEEIVSMHNGTLTLSNAEGGGILVTIRLPIGEQ